MCNLSGYVELRSVFYKEYDAVKKDEADLVIHQNKKEYRNIA